MLICDLYVQTGGSKGYAFVEFESKYTAKTVADCMNNYLMFHRLLKCKILSVVLLIQLYCYGFIELEGNTRVSFIILHAFFKPLKKAHS